MKNKIDWELDSFLIKKQLSLHLAHYFVRKGRKYVDENFYFIHVFIKSFIESNLVDTIKQIKLSYLKQNPNKEIETETNLDAHFNIIGYAKCHSATKSPKSLLPHVINFIRSNGDIVSTFEKYLKFGKQKTRTTQMIIDAPQYNLQLLSDKFYFKDEPSHLNLRIFQNTSLENLIDFVDTYKSLIKQYQKQGCLNEYPHQKKGKNSFDFFKLMVVDQKKQQIKTKNQGNSKANLTLNTDQENAFKLYGDEYGNLDLAKKGANRMRVQRHRTLLRLK